MKKGLRPSSLEGMISPIVGTADLMKKGLRRGELRLESLHVNPFLMTFSIESQKVSISFGVV